ncbi:hypothetical protein SLS55_006958 [Diplodia seriata]|uniref:Uncharacterized protein n=1 Tax=Diplodia seriata TaxID=420778 RepID=A0A1S8BC05_9PEZI|nr:hypothetical protein BK809_0000776 [Diplodia seriata]
MKAVFLVAGCTAALAHLARGSPLVAREDKDDSCGANLQVCNPSGASTDKLPALGHELSGLYLSLLDSVQGINFKRDIPIQPRDTPSFCCATGTSCLVLSTYNVPFCYDKFTTNYIFPDGSSGTIFTGDFSSAAGGTANLITGNYTGGKNLYSADDPDAAADKPDTATLSIPPQYTDSGVGSAIPLTALGATVVVTAVATTTSTVPASLVVVPASTRPASTVPGTTVAGVTTRPDSVVPPTTIPASTSTVVAARETVVTVMSAVTTTEESAAASGTGAAASGEASASATGAAAAAAAGAGEVLGAAAAAALLVLGAL